VEEIIMKYLMRSVVTLIILLSICACSRSGRKTKLNERFINPREVELKLTYKIEGIKIEKTDTVTMQEFSEEAVSWKMEKHNTEPTLLLYIARQEDYQNQRYMEYISIDPKPDKIYSRDINGNAIEFWDLSDQIKDGKDIIITRHFKFMAYETAFNVDPSKVEKYNTQDPYYKYYTRTQEFLEQTPNVINLAKSIVGNEKNPYLQAKKIYKWCIDNIDYVYPDNRGTRFCIPRRTGDCGSYSLIFTNLCRSLGIPARVANGHWCCEKKKNYHVWNEFYIPGYGWLPADATDGKITGDYPGKLAGNGDYMYFFGNLDSGRFISSKGTSIQLYPSAPWHKWGLADENRNPIFFQTAATVFANITIEKQKTEMEIIKGNDILW
jgi:transglutaminase-like putative cysteine protease